MKAVNDIIRAVREDRDKKQKEIAKVLHISQKTYSDYERGIYQFPVRHIIALSKYYNISSDYLLGLIDCEIPIGGRDYQLESELIESQGVIDSFRRLNHKEKVAVVEYMNLIKRKSNERR